MTYEEVVHREVSIKIIRIRLIEKIESTLKAYMISMLPGLYSMLDTLAKIKYGCKLAELLLNDPRKIYRLLITMYGNEDAAKHIIRSMIVEPLNKILTTEELKLINIPL